MKTDPLVIVLTFAIGFGMALLLALMSPSREADRPVTPEDFAMHPVTCTYSPHTPSIVQCVGDVPIHLEGRRIRLISEPWDGGAP